MPLRDATPRLTQIATAHAFRAVREGDCCVNGTCTASSTTGPIIQYGITWHFDGEYEYVQFANGDYWVKGPVVITRITSDFDGSLHGFEISPMDYGNMALIPGLPVTVGANKSVLKAISFIDCDDDGAYCPGGDSYPSLKPRPC